MELGLKGRVALVTGGSGSLGSAIACSLAAEGANVAICARRLEPLIAVQSKINNSGGKAVVFSVDATDPHAVKNAVSYTVEQFHRLDILINTVGGVRRFGGFDELADDDWIDTYKLNVMSTVYFVRCSIAHLRHSRAPRIINISSISGIQPGSYNPHYTIVKASIINLTKYLAKLYARENILANVICPGTIHSESWESNVQRIADIKGISFAEARILVDKEDAQKIPLGRVGEGSDVAGLVTFLASDQGSYITGACFSVDGGKLNSIW